MPMIATATACAMAKGKEGPGGGRFAFGQSQASAQLADMFPTSEESRAAGQNVELGVCRYQPGYIKLEISL